MLGSASSAPWTWWRKARRSIVRPRKSERSEKSALNDWLARLPVAHEFRLLGLKILFAPANKAVRCMTKLGLGEAVDRSGACRRCQRPSFQHASNRLCRARHDCCSGNRIPQDNDADAFRCNAGRRHACRA